jgi:S1-C subfamily serine protease
MGAAVLLALLLLASPVSVRAEPSIQEVLLRAKPAVAMVVTEIAGEVVVRCGTDRDTAITPPPLRETSSGWFVHPDGWIITSAHVVSPAHRPPDRASRELIRMAVRSACLPAVLARRGLRPGEGPELEERLDDPALTAAITTAKIRLEPSIFVILSNGVRLPATVAKYSPPAGEAMSGRDLALLKLEAADMPSLPVGDSAGPKLGDRVHILGFPGVVLSHELLNASARVEASVTNGAVSGFKQDVSGQSVIQTDAPAAWGNSGGPAVNSRGEVVGVLVSVSGDEQGAVVQGFNFLIPSAAVKEFLRDSPVRIGAPGRFNEAWYAALDAFFTGDHRRAARHFAEANRLLPELPDVRRLSGENEERLANPPRRPIPWVLVASALAAASAGALAMLWARHWRRNRHRIKAAEVARLLDTETGRPLLLDVRDPETYARSPVRIPGARHLSPRDLEGTSALDVESERTVVAYCT